MSNEEVAAILGTIAKLLDMQGESTFKVRAYQRVAQEIKHLPMPIAELVAEGTLRTIPGIGDELEKKLVELVSTGRLAYYQQLQAQFPPGVLDLLRLSGLGPKLAAQLWKDLQVTDLDSLESALRSGKVAALPRVGPKTQENLLQELEALKQA